MPCWGTSSVRLAGVEEERTLRVQSAANSPVAQSTSQQQSIDNKGLVVVVTVVGAPWGRIQEEFFLTQKSDWALNISSIKGWKTVPSGVLNRSHRETGLNLSQTVWCSIPSGSRIATIRPSCGRNWNLLLLSTDPFLRRWRLVLKLWRVWIHCEWQAGGRYPQGKPSLCVLVLRRRSKSIFHPRILAIG